MKKFLASVLIAASVAFTGCGDSNDDFVFVQQQNQAPVTGFFVDAAAGNDATGNGATGAPFATVQAALAAAGVNGTVVVRPGNYAGAVNLLNGQRLIGAGFENVLPQGAVRPVFAGGPINLADGNIVRGIRVENSAADAIIGVGRNGGTISNCQIINSGDEGIFLEPATGNWSIVNNTINTTGPGGLGIVLNTSNAGVARVIVNGNTISNCTLSAMSFASSQTSQLALQANNNILNGNGAAQTFEILAGNGAIICLDAIGNTNDDTYRLAALNTSVIRIEQFATFTNLNTGTITLVGGSNPVVDIADGSCGF